MGSTSRYPILDVDGWSTIENEQLGTKAKIWVEDPDGVQWLFKHPRAKSGEHWAEVVAARVAAALRIPHAAVELARFESRIGSISRSFLGNPIQPRSLLLGNALLHRADRSYRPGERRPREHAVDRVLRRLGHIAAPIDTPESGDLQSAADVLVGYLLLDALIGNTDRHHENWGVLTEQSDAQLVTRLAPTFDHASALGRELADRRRDQKLRNVDPRHDVHAYCARGRSPWFESGPPVRALTTREAFRCAQTARPAAAAAWLDGLRSISPESLARIVEGLPKEVATDVAKRFAIAVLHSNRAHLLGELP